MSKRLRKQISYNEDEDNEGSDLDFLNEDDSDSEIDEYKIDDDNDDDYKVKEEEEDDDDNDDYDEEEEEKPKKRGGKKASAAATTKTTKATGEKKTRGRKKKTDTDDADAAAADDADEKPKRATKTTKATKATKATKETKGTKTTRGRKKKKDDDDDDNAGMDVEKSDSNDDDDDDAFREDDNEVYTVHNEEEEEEKEKKPKRSGAAKSIEEQYQKLTPLEHVLKRPDTYIGSVEKIDQEMWTLSDDMERFEQRKIVYVPGLYKIFDEIIVNAADNKQRDPRMNKIDVRIDSGSGVIDVWNNGLGIPVERHKTENMYVPELIFGHLLTGSNYDDNERKVTGGKNGLGAKLANIFSLEFKIETADGKKCYKQRWTNNMGSMDPPTITASKDQYTRVTFRPDYARFKMAGLEEDTRRLMCKRVYDLAGCNAGIRVYLNGARVPVASFKDYIAMYLRRKEEAAVADLALADENSNSGVISNENSNTGVISNENSNAGTISNENSNSGVISNENSNNLYNDDDGENDDDDDDDEYNEGKKKQQKKKGGRAKKGEEGAGGATGGSSRGRKRKEDAGAVEPFIVCRCNERWEVGIALSDGEFQQVSFVNSINTYRGGSHVNLVVELITKYLMPLVTKKAKKDADGLKGSAVVKPHLWVFVNALIENPSFNSQSKDCLDSKPSDFGSRPELPEEFLKRLVRMKIVERCVRWAQSKKELLLMKKNAAPAGKKATIRGIPKLSDATNAGTRRSEGCTLILTEGDSAKSLALAGIDVVGRENYGVFPLRGKVLNVRDGSKSKMYTNEELKNICKIMGLKYKEKYDAGTRALRYGHLMIMADQDFDGSHIKGLIVSFIHDNWPELTRVPGFLTEFITPIVKAKRKGEEIAFYTVPQYEDWKRRTPQRGWTIKYYKGLGSSTKAEGKEYFRALDRHKIDFAYSGAPDDEAIDLAFSKKRADERKAWMERYVPGTYLDQDTDAITYSDFINKELILFSINNCERSIPSIVDGLKPVQRKVLYVSFQRRLTRVIKVCELSGIVSSATAYHHGETSLHEAIVGLAQNFVGSNNINLMYPDGIFGSRRQGGKDHASARYIHTRLSSVARRIFHPDDDPILEYLDDDGKKIEPRWFIPVIPMALVNGCDGIGTGWSTSIPHYNPRDIIAAIRALLAGKGATASASASASAASSDASNEANASNGAGLPPIHPWYRGWTGELTLDPRTKGYRMSCPWKYTSTPGQIEITELPLGVWTEDYKEFLEGLLVPSEKRKEPLIRDYKELHFGESIRFVVDLADPGMSDEAITKAFKLGGSVSLANMVGFNRGGSIVQYRSIEIILREFFDIRMEYYDRRKKYLIAELERNYAVLANKCRFIQAIVAGTLVLRNVKKAQIFARLHELNFEKFHPSATAQRGGNGGTAKGRGGAAADNDMDIDMEGAGTGEGEADNGDNGSMDPDEISDEVGYSYLLSMKLWSLTLEKKEELESEMRKKLKDLEDLRNSTIAQLYEKDLADLEEALIEWEKTELNEEEMVAKKKKVVSARKLKKTRPRLTVKKEDDDENDGDVDMFNGDDDSDFEGTAAAAAQSKQRKRQARVKKDPDAPADEAAPEKPKRKPRVKKETEGEENGDKEDEKPKRKPRAPRKTAAAVKKEQVDEEKEKEKDGKENEYYDIFKVKGKKEEKEEPPKKRLRKANEDNVIDLVKEEPGSDDDDLFGVDEKKKKEEKKEEKKRGRKKKKVEEEEEEEEKEEEAPALSFMERLRNGTIKKSVGNFLSDSDSDKDSLKESDSEDDDDTAFDFNPSKEESKAKKALSASKPKKAAPKKQTKSRKKKTYDDDDDDEEDYEDNDDEDDSDF